jgi:hypothetical protein
MDRFDDGIRCSCQETIDQMRARNGFRLGAPVALEFGPDASEREQRAVIVEREPNDVFLFGLGVRLRRILGETVRRDQAAVFRVSFPIARIPGMSLNRNGDHERDRFNGGGAGTRWYYQSLANIFSEVMPGRLSDRLSRAVTAFSV